jgi:predicted nucleic acid-binding protein
VIGPVLVDNSAWTRLAVLTLDTSRLRDVHDAVARDNVHACTPFLLEAGYSARRARDHRALLAQLRSLPFAAIDPSVEASVLDAQAELARAGHHRLPPINLLIAAIADHHGLGILHYDGDYDIISERTSLKFDSVWLAPRGSL